MGEIGSLMQDAALGDLLSAQVTTLLLVFVRILGLMLFAPIFSSAVLPLTFRFYLVMAISLTLAPVVPPPREGLLTMAGAAIDLLGEMSIGLILGTSLQFVFSGLQLAGQTSGTQLGLALANVINPQFDDQTSTTAVIYVTVASLIFFATGLDRELFRALFETFEVIPLGQVGMREAVLPFMLEVFQQSMIFAIRVSAPVIVALLLAEMAMGFVSRTVPQLNILSIGFSVRILVGLVITMAALSDVGRVFCSYVGDALVVGFDAITHLSPRMSP